MRNIYAILYEDVVLLLTLFVYDFIKRKNLLKP